jgi:hypothetical protein
MYSVGGQDGMVAQFGHQHYLEVTEENDLF